MSVIVKGMEMPDNCFECPCCRHDSVDGTKMEQCNLTLDVFDVNYFERWNGRAQNCPLIELPPHGRLIAEKTITEIRYHDADGYHIVNGEQLCELEIDAETVIEGSET